MQELIAPQANRIETALHALDVLHLAYAEAATATLVTLDATMRSAAEFYGLQMHELSNG